ncbi:F-box protein [Aspergillus undulatus]|uniref:F-box protein n=1 Tax=Aspergillus undulatus TaxID=1810928 RepID=UPI003CCD2123
MPGIEDSTFGCPMYNSSTTDWIRCLPPEIALQILSYLSFGDLLSFGATSRLNNEYHIVSLKRLRLGVFEKRVHSLISVLQAGWAGADHLTGAWVDNETERHYTVSLVQQHGKSTKVRAQRSHPSKAEMKQRSQTSRNKPQTQEQMIRLQNQTFAKALKRYGQSLRDLEFMAYDLNQEGATALGTHCQHTLRHLALRYEHQHIRDGVMRPSAWLHPAPGNEAWNSLIGIGRFKDTGLCNLESLILERAGITSWQLMMLVKKNPNLTTLKLRTVRGARPEFLYWLGGMKSDLDEGSQSWGPAPGANLEVLALEHCHRLLEHPTNDEDNVADEACDSGFEWVRGLTNLRSLSFSESANIPPMLIDRANKKIWKIPEVILPYCLYDANMAIAVDPRWK